jgi:hypothetical protein
MWLFIYIRPTSTAAKISDLKYKVLTAVLLKIRSFGLRRVDTGRIVPDILQDGNVFMFRVRQSVCLEMFDPEVDGTMTLPNVGYLLGQRHSITNLKTQNLIHIICIHTSQKRREY